MAFGDKFKVKPSDKVKLSHLKADDDAGLSDKKETLKKMQQDLDRLSQ